MTTNQRSRTVFEDIDPDPDAILAEFDVDSPAELIDEGGAHDPLPDDELDVDDVTASELFDDLQEYETAHSQPTYRTDSTDVRLIGAESADSYEEATPEELEFEFVGDSDVVVREAAETVESSGTRRRTLSPDEPTTTAFDSDGATEAGDSPAGGATDAGDTSARSRSGTELELVGPDPTPTRISDDAFGATIPSTSSDGH